MSVCFEQRGSHMLCLNTAVSERTGGWRRNLEPRTTWCSLLDNGMWNWPHHICVSSLLLLTLPISHVTTNYRLQHVPTHADTHPLFSLALDGIAAHTWNGVHACLNPHLNLKSAKTSDKVHCPPSVVWHAHCDSLSRSITARHQHSDDRLFIWVDYKHRCAGVVM